MRWFRQGEQMLAPKRFSRSDTRLNNDNDNDGTFNALAALVKPPVSTTLLKYHITRN